MLKIEVDKEKTFVSASGNMITITGQLTAAIDAIYSQFETDMERAIFMRIIKEIPGMIEDTHKGDK